MHTPQTLHDSSPYGVHCKVNAGDLGRLLSKLLRLSQSSILRADKDILILPDEVRPICMDGRRALIIDEKYPGRDKKFVTCVIDGSTGEILWLKEGKGTASPDGFFRSLTPEQKEDIEVVSIDRGNAYLKALREHLPHVSISFDPFHIIKNVNDAVDEVRFAPCLPQCLRASGSHRGCRFPPPRGYHGRSGAPHQRFPFPAFFSPPHDLH
ncbi:MAG: transposase [Akkermansia sp.]|nr:transposase [Akkermansia sp.]